MEVGAVIALYIVAGVALVVLMGFGGRELVKYVFGPNDVNDSDRDGDINE